MDEYQMWLVTIMYSLVYQKISVLLTFQAWFCNEREANLSIHKNIGYGIIEVTCEDDVAVWKREHHAPMTWSTGRVAQLCEEFHMREKSF